MRPTQPSINDPLRPPFVPQHCSSASEIATEQWKRFPSARWRNCRLKPAPFELAPPEPVDISRQQRAQSGTSEPRKQRSAFKLPPTSLLQEPPERTAFDSLELKETAASIKSKFEEFNVRGTRDSN